jgi:hypothetical protein
VSTPYVPESAPPQSPSSRAATGTRPARFREDDEVRHLSALKPPADPAGENRSQHHRQKQENEPLWSLRTIMVPINQ